MERAIDLVFLSYFVFHIPIFIFIDSQALGPRWMYPKQVSTEYALRAVFRGVQRIFIFVVSFCLISFVCFKLLHVT